MRLVLLALVLFAHDATANGAEIHRCVSDNGSVSYQDVACERGTRLSRTIEVKVAAGATDTAGKPAKSVKSPSTTRPAKSATGQTASRSAQRRECANARKARDAKLQRLGLNRTFDQLRALDDAVAEACKGL